MELKVIDSVTESGNEEFLRQAARLHHESLSYRSFITLFGVPFLYRIYETVLLKRQGILVAAHESGVLKGFTLGCLDTNRLTGMMLKRLAVFLPLVASALIKHPGLLGKLWETLFYADKEGVDVKPEMVVIAVVEAERSKGLGAELMRRLEAAFKEQGVSRYKVTVHRDMEESNRFYQRNGMVLRKEFKMYGYVWNVYAKEII